MAAGGPWTNVFIGRLWRSVKQECLYLQGFDTVPELTQGLGDYFDSCNPFLTTHWFYAQYSDQSDAALYRHERPNQALDYCTPAEVYGGRAKRRQRSWAQQTSRWRQSYRPCAQ
jgi:transposase InsO family protein